MAYICITSTSEAPTRRVRSSGTRGTGSTGLPRVFGIGPALLGTAFMVGLGAVFVPLSTVATAPYLLVAYGLISSFGSVVFSVNARSLMQSVVPPRLLGRAFATHRFVSWSANPLGALAVGSWAATSDSGGRCGWPRQASWWLSSPRCCRPFGAWFGSPTTTNRRRCHSATGRRSLVGRLEPTRLPRPERPRKALTRR